MEQMFSVWIWTVAIFNHKSVFLVVFMKQVETVNDLLGGSGVEA